jgi:hypothetical protein
MMKKSICASLGICFILIMVATMGFSQIDDSTTLYYSFDKSVGKKVPDGLGKHDGELGGDAKITTGRSGRFGEGLRVDGDGDYVRSGNIGAPEEGTIEAWIKLEEYQKHNDGDGIAGMGNEYGGTGDIMLFGVHQQFNLNLQFGMYAGGWKWADSGVDINDFIGKWHHVAGTWGKRGLEVWIDGEKKGENKAYTAGIPNPAYITLLIGSNSWRGDLNGIIDEFRVSNIQRKDNFLLDLAVEVKGKLTS